MQSLKYVPEITVFTSGSIIMIYELVGTRVLGPYFGTSLYVWTNLIAVFLGSLSIGYRLGGLIADRSANHKILGYLTFSAGLFIILTLTIKDPVLSFLSKSIHDVGIGSVLATIILFMPSSIFMGMVSPIAAKLKLNSLTTTGSSIAKLYTLSALGSIAGTFLAGYWLIPSMGTNKLILTLGIALISLSLYISVSEKKLKIISLVSCICGLFILDQYRVMQVKSNFIDKDTHYNRVWIYQGKHTNSDKTVRVMGINGENHSSMFIESPELVNQYTQYFHLISHFVPNFRTTLMLGGAGYSFPKDYLRLYPEASIDVVEIDPGVTQLAKEYFKLTDDPRLSITHQDARIYLNNASTKYDAIISDVFSSRYGVPFHLTTRETALHLYRLLADEGIIILNLISTIEGPGSNFFRASYHTMSTVFPHVYTIPVTSSNPSELQNIILIGVKSTQIPSLHSRDEKLNSYLQNIWKSKIQNDLPILTDDFAPVESYVRRSM